MLQKNMTSSFFVLSLSVVSTSLQCFDDTKLELNEWTNASIFAEADNAMLASSSAAEASDTFYIPESPYHAMSQKKQPTLLPNPTTIASEEIKRLTTAIGSYINKFSGGNVVQFMDHLDNLRRAIEAYHVFLYHIGKEEHKYEANSFYIRAQKYAEDAESGINEMLRPLLD